MDYTLSMADVGARIQRVIEELMGNEALFEMLEGESATEMLNWGIAMGTSIVKSTKESRDTSSELSLLPRLKALRQTIRSVGNWAAGKYADPADRLKLRDKLMEHFEVIFGEDARLPSASELTEILDQGVDQTLTPLQRISKLRSMFESTTFGGKRA